MGTASVGHETIAIDDQSTRPNTQDGFTQGQTSTGLGVQDRYLPSKYASSHFDGRCQIPWKVDHRTRISYLLCNLPGSSVNSPSVWQL